MRITGGSFKGKHFIAPDSVRPTASKVRQAIFNILGTELVRNSRVLDLYAGSGALGLEALSRGARRCVFVEKDLPIATCLNQTIKRLSLEEWANVHVLDVGVSLNKLKKSSEVFDLVFIDPPYAILPHRKVLENLVHFGLLSERAHLVLEYTSKCHLNYDEKEFLLLQTKTYGDTTVKFLRRKK